MRKIFSLIFVFLLVLPAVAWLIGLDFVINADHKKLDPPRPYGLALFDNEYYLSFNQYFNHSFSLRSPLIFAKSYLDYHIFRTTDATSVHIGKNGWLYSRRSIDDYRKGACSGRADIGQMVLELQALEKIIEASGSRFLFIVAPNKSTVYPEHVGFVPNTAGCNRSRYDLLLESIAEYPLRSFVRLDEQLRQAKKGDALLYDKISTYWNGLGATAAAETIHQQIFDRRSEKRPADYDSSGIISTGDLYNQLMGFPPLAEEGSFQRFVNSDQPDLPTGLLYGDAFVENLLPYVARMFKQLDVIPADRVPSKLHSENLRAYDFILLETAESDLATVHIDLDKIFSLVEHEVQIPQRYPLDLRAAVPVSHISLDLRKDGLEIKSMGSQSVFELTSVPGSDENIFRVLKLSIAASQSNIMTVTCLTGSPYVTPKSLKSGISEIYLPLPFQKVLSLRIQPGNGVDLLMLRSAEVLRFMRNPSILEPLPDKITVAKTEHGDEFKFLREGSTASISKSKVDTEISAAMSDGAVSDFNSETVASGDVEVSSSRESSFEVKNQDAQYTLIPKDSKTVLSISKAEIDDSLAAADSANGDTSPGDVVSVGAEVPTSIEPSIAVADFEDGRIFQRRGRSTDIVVSGTYAGMPEAIEARVVRDSTFEEIVPWTVIDPFPRNGIFLGVLSDVPQGGWYNIQVRYCNNHSGSSYGTHKWGIGILVACLGQSNMKEWFYTGTTLRAHPLLRKFTVRGWAEPGSKGNGAIVFGNRIIERLGIPVGLLDYSKNGSGLRKEADWGTGYWEDTSPGSIYNRFLGGVSNTGGAVEFVVWIQGEADAARGTVTEDEYRNSLESFITNQVRADIHNGSDREYLPFLIVMMVKRPGGKDKPHQVIRNAQKHVAENVADCYVAATTLDLRNQGRQHLSTDAFVTMGRRVAQTVLFILGEEKYYRGPEVAEANRIDNRTIDVRIDHRGGTDFTPNSGISGWEILVNGIPVPIAEVNRHDPQTIRITLKSPLADKAMIRYLYGSMPDTSKPVLDNSAMFLPLEEYQSEIQ
jgi:hypothetical protein